MVVELFRYSEVKMYEYIEIRNRKVSTKWRCLLFASVRYRGCTVFRYCKTSVITKSVANVIIDLHYCSENLETVA